MNYYERMLLKIKKRELENKQKMNKYGISARSSWVKPLPKTGHCNRCDILLSSKFAGKQTNGFCETCFDEIINTD